MYYVYILKSLNYPNRYYTGFTRDLEKRLKSHNHGQDTHTNKFKPWSIKTYLGFSDKQQALEFERYLKTPSGRAFAKKRLYFARQSEGVRAHALLAPLITFPGIATLAPQMNPKIHTLSSKFKSV